MTETKPKKLNVLPSNPEVNNGESEEKVVKLGRFPSWLHRSLPIKDEARQTKQIISENRLHTVCEEARCPNLPYCWSQKTATFLIMGKECTRSCGFCDIDFSKTPKALDSDEPKRVAESVRALGLKHVVITMVARDDLSDGGSAHLVSVMETVRKENPAVTIEVLTSDFAGNRDAWKTILDAAPDIFNHNIETTRELTPRVRHKATYERTLELLHYAAYSKKSSKIKVKSGLMVGLGESKPEVLQTLQDLATAGCAIVTIGQYLQSNAKGLLVKRFVTPEEFAEYQEYGQHLKIAHVYSAPFVRSSYNAHLFA